VINQRIPREWLEEYKKAYEYWQKGQEMPLNGFPIKGWGIISPAQQETLIKMHVLTVEQLSVINDEGLRRIGMGALDLKNKAEAWLKTLKKAGASTLEISELKADNERMRINISNMENKIAELTKLLKRFESESVKEEMPGISLDDLYESDPVSH